MTLRLTKHFSFEMAHALPLYEGKCHNIHGHSYHLAVTVEGGPAAALGGLADDGMVIDFGRIKSIVTRCVVDPFDHALVLPLPQDMPAASSPLPEQGEVGGYAAKVFYTSFQPTTENLLLHFARLLDGQFPDGARLYSLALSETDTSTAELFF